MNLLKDKRLSRASSRDSLLLKTKQKAPEFAKKASGGIPAYKNKRFPIAPPCSSGDPIASLPPISLSPPQTKKKKRRKNHEKRMEKEIEAES
jgi:hypothetical protein